MSNTEKRPKLDMEVSGIKSHNMHFRLLQPEY